MLSDAFLSRLDTLMLAMKGRASGGAGGSDDFLKLFQTIPSVSAGLAASIFHFGEVEIRDLKDTLRNNAINVR